MHTHIHTYVHTFVHAYIHLHIHLRIHLQPFTYTFTNTYTYTYTDTYIFKYTYPYMHLHTFTYIYIHLLARIHALHYITFTFTFTLTLHYIHTYVALSRTSFVCTWRFGLPFGVFFFLILRVFCLQNLARDDYCLGAGPNRYCNPTTALLIIIIILIFILMLILSILSILIILIIPIILIILIILFVLIVLIIVVINSFLLPSLSSSSIFFIVFVSNLINIKRLALFVTCNRSWLAASNSEKPRETVAAFRLRLAIPLVRLPPYPSLASFRTSPLASSFGFLDVFAAISAQNCQKPMEPTKKTTQRGL